MKQIQQAAIGISTPADRIARLDLVIPYTTPELTRVALRAAGRLGEGLDSDVRVLKVQVVPFPLDLRCSPIPVEFLESQLTHLCGDEPHVPFTSEIRFARESEQGLRGALRFRSLVVLASKKRLWRTRTERLAASLRLAGYTVVMVNEDSNKGRDKGNNNA